MLSSNRKKFWWFKLKFSLPFTKGNHSSKRKDGKENNLSEKLNVNEEYKEVFRTQSYMEILSKVHVQLPRSPKTTSSYSYSSSSSNSSISSSSSSSSIPLYIHLSDLLEPHQDVIDTMQTSKIQTLIIHYFDASIEACNTCESLLRGIHKTRLNHRRIQRVIDLSQGRENNNKEEEDQECNEKILQELASYANLSNPLPNINNSTIDFPMIREKYTFLLHKLTTKRRKIKRKEKFTRVYKKAIKYGFIISYIVLIITLWALEAHSMLGFLGAPRLLLPFSMTMMKKLRDYINNNDNDNDNIGRLLKLNILKHLGEQLDVAARGIYIFINDFDTVGRLVTRLHDEVQHRREIAVVCVRNGKCNELMREALRDIEMQQQGFEEQLQELEEHIYFCFLTINRSRRLVIQEILDPLNAPWD
ncbi:unnamed protein product [Amaranthus hypochondriacus]